MSIDLPDCIRRARIDAGLWQAELADLLGVRQSTVSQWERGIVNPSVEHLLLLVCHLGAGVLDLQRPGACGGSTDDLPDRLRAARLDAGLTQADVGALIGVSAGRVSRWELGYVPLREPETLDLFAEIAKAGRQRRRPRLRRQAMGT